MDGTKIKAHAQSKFTGTIENFNKRKETLESKINLAVKKLEESQQSEESKKYWENKIERHEKDLEKINTFLNSAEKILTIRGDEVQQNVNDSDCRIMKDKGSYVEAYNVQATVCENTGIIVSCDTTNHSNDSANFVTNFEKTKENLEKIGSPIKLEESENLADAGYYSTGNIEYIANNEINAFIPKKQDKNVYMDKKDKAKVILEKQKLTSEDIDIIQTEDGVEAYCPNNLKLCQDDKLVKDRESYYYCFHKEDKSECVNCQFYDLCYGKNKYKTFKIREGIINNYKNIKQMQEKLECDEGRMIYSKRMPMIEKVFGQIKHNLNFRRFTRVGMDKVSVQWNMVCTAFNIKKLFVLKYGNQ